MSYFARTSYSLSSPATTFTVGFPYISKTHVHVFVNGIEVTPTWSSDGTQVIVTSVAAFIPVLIQRITPSATLLVTFTDGSVANADQANTADEQCLYVMQETQDSFSVLNDWARSQAFAGGSVPAAIFPGDQNKVLTAQSGMFVWSNDLVINSATVSSTVTAGGIVTAPEFQIDSGYQFYKTSTTRNIGFISGSGLLYDIPAQTLRFQYGGSDIVAFSSALAGFVTPAEFYSATPTKFGVTPTVGVANYVVWNAGNMGSSSGLNADMVDGYHAGQLISLASGLVGSFTASLSGGVYFIDITRSGLISSVDYSGSPNYVTSVNFASPLAHTDYNVIISSDVPNGLFPVIGYRSDSSCRFQWSNGTSFVAAPDPISVMIFLK